jgi:2-methylisocitrate lyase-like PEP mutase family enzyme
MDAFSKAARLRELHCGSTFLLPNAWTVGSALRLERLGFQAIGTTSAGIALDAGVEDGEPGRGRTLAVAGAIAGALAVPVSADLENGFDDSAEGCAATVLEAVSLGVAGGSIEDATGRVEDPIYPLDHAVARIRAVRQALRSRDADFVLTARSENFLHGRPDLADTIARLKAFEEAGADVLFAPGLPDIAAIRAVRAALSRPLNVLLGSDETGLTARDVADAGVARISLGSALARAADRASLELARAAQAGLAPHQSKEMSLGPSA